MPNCFIIKDLFAYLCTRTNNQKIMFEILKSFETKYGYLKKKGLTIEGLAMVDIKKKKHVIKVKVPAGIESGHSLRVSGAGNAGLKGGPAGDLYVLVNVEPHPHFNRDGNNLYYRTQISFLQAILGDEIKIPTLEGDSILKIPSGTQPNTNFKIKERGLPQLNHREKGSLYVLVEVQIPTKLTREQEKLLRNYRDVTA